MRGFTLIEMAVVMGIFTILVSIGVISLANIERSSSLNAEVSKIIPSIKEQQIKAMAGDTEGSGTINDYGIHFESSSYTLFRGTYSVGNANNLVVTIDPNIQISSTFPGAQVLFSRGSGEVASFVNGSNTITFTDTTNGRTQTITVNRLGVITGIN